MSPDFFHRIRNFDAVQVFTTAECPVSYSFNGGGNRDFPQVIAQTKSVVVYIDDRTGDDGVAAAKKKSVGCGLDDGVAMISGVVNRIGAVHFNTPEVFTSDNNLRAQFFHRFWNMDAAKITGLKSTSSNF